MDIEPIIDVAKAAGAEILKVYQREFSVQEKEDKSPVTEADHLANEVIHQGLQSAFPEIPYLSEEAKAIPYAERKAWTRFWLVDPLDGTKEFIKKNGEFTVNIALIEEGVPVVGVVYQPAINTTYSAIQGRGAHKVDAQGTESQLRGGPHYSSLERVRVVASRSHMSPETEAFVEQIRQSGKQVELTSSGSSLKLCMVAEGTADVYPRFAPTMEWDTAAAHAVALEAGRVVLQSDARKSLRYNKENLLNPWFIVE